MCMSRRAVKVKVSVLVYSDVKSHYFITDSLRILRTLGVNSLSSLFLIDSSIGMMVRVGTEA
jgi:hypothetical protein